MAVFRVRDAGSTVGREVIAGTTTFFTMCYIVFVQPAVMGAAGMDAGAVMVATCISSALATVLMGLLANYPVALAPAMGHNFFFTYTVCIGMGFPWQTALACVFISGAIFVILSFVGLRERIISALPVSLQQAIAAGIGLFIALIGLEWAGLVVPSPGTLICIGRLGEPAVLLSIFGIGVTLVFVAARVPGALLLGILITTAGAILTGVTEFSGEVMSMPPSLAPTFAKLDLPSALSLTLLPVIFVFLFLDMFDTVGTLVGVSTRAGLMVDGRLPRAKQALFSDAAGTVAGAVLGTSTVTSYIESAAGVNEGGRTGLSNMVTAGWFVIALFFWPLVAMVGGAVFLLGRPDFPLHPMVAPALIVVGAMMLKGLTRVNWDDATEYIPAFLAMVVMPFTFSITEGISVGFISYSLMKIATRRWREAHWLIHLFALLFILRYIYLPYGG